MIKRNKLVTSGKAKMTKNLGGILFIHFLCITRSDSELRVNLEFFLLFLRKYLNKVIVNTYPLSK